MVPAEGQSPAPAAGPSQAAPAATCVAAVDVGSNSIRLVIAQVTPDGKIEVLENLQRAVRLGQDTFLRGRLTPATIRAAVAVLRDYRKLIDTYGVQRIRAVATSAVREAGNADAFLDRVLMITGLEVAVIDTSEESRLTVSAIRQDVGKALDERRGNVLLAEVGGGSTLLTVLDGGHIAASQSLMLGSIRLQEMLATSSETPERSMRLLEQEVVKIIAVNRDTLGLGRVQTFIATGADARFAAAQAGELTEWPNLARVAKADLGKLLRQSRRQTPEQLARQHGLSFPEAEMLNPALLIHQALLQATRARQMIVSQVSMRDGLLLDLARSVTGREDPALWEGVLGSAQAVAEKYRVDRAHSENVAAMAVSLFDQLQTEHGLKPRHRLLLQVAGLVHEVGGFVSSRSHHKHSYYLLANSEIFGLTREETLTVALLSRYHRRSMPKAAHPEYMAVPREVRMIVNKLAAILRLADALDRGHAQQVRQVRCERREDELVIVTPGVADLALERRAMTAKADLFEEIFGLKVSLREESAPRPAGEGAAD
jgi:exopolyphosphatase / guanosine-5'-triphosphate,3'-diphosphate pyrophosphatase